MSNNKAKFFCEYCDTEVPHNAKFCPKCGHFFSSVRCPACGKTGDHGEFTNGCPACGYAFGNSNENVKNVQKLPPKASRKTRKNAAKLIFAKSGEAEIQKKRHDEELPIWIYIITGLVFIGIMTFLMYII